MLTKFRSLSRELVPVHLDGNVSIDPTAAIAPGVLLQAEADSRITIGAGVCIGAGTIVHAAGGNIDIGAGVCIGRGVLIIGTGLVDRNACIGAGTTIMNPQIEEGNVVATHSILGDTSRGEVSVVETPDLPPPPAAPTASSDDVDTSDVWETSIPIPAMADPPVESTFQSEPAAPSQENFGTETVEIIHRSHEYVAGRASFDRLKRQLFPNG